MTSTEQIRQQIQQDPYNLTLYVDLAQQYLDLAYPDLAAGAAYKALLLCDAVEDEGDEFHEQAAEAILPLSHSRQQQPDSTAEANNSLDESGSIGSSVVEHFLLAIYQLLIRSLLQCGSYQSAFTYCSQAGKKFPDDTNLHDLQLEMYKGAAQHFGTDVNGPHFDSLAAASDLPDNGFIRREVYPWNNFEPDRLNELSTLNAMMNEVAPKLEVLAVNLPNLTKTQDGNDVSIKQLGVFAKEDIPPGEVVLIESSILTANNKLQDTLCDACSADLPELGSPEAQQTVSCPDCEVVFCSQECSDRAMELYHPALCDMDIESIAKDVPPARASDALYSLLLLRALAMAETQQCHPLELKEVKYIWGDFNDAASYNASEETLKSLPFSFTHNIRLPFHMLEKMDIDIFTNPQYDVWVFNTLYAKFRGTASARLSGRGGRNARGPEVGAVHPMWCLANHSCDPNVSWEWGGNIEFRTRERRVTWRKEDGRTIHQNEAGIKKGEEVLNHYCDTDLPVRDRREWARGALGGDCRCQRCVWEAGEEG